MLGTVGIYAGMRGWKPEQLVYALGAEPITEENAPACGLENKLFEGSREEGYYGFFLHTDCTPLAERPNATCLAFCGMEWHDNEEEPDVDHVCKMRFLDKDGNTTRTIMPDNHSNVPLSVFSVAANTILCYSPYGLFDDSDETYDSDTPVCSPLQALRVNLLTHAADVVTIVPASPDVEAKMGEFLSEYGNDGPEYVQLGRMSAPGQYAVLLAVYTPGFEPDPCMQIGTLTLALV
jgi:hypothetical protein